MPTVKAVKAWLDSDGTLHATIEGWQQAELVRLLGTTDGSGGIANEGETQMNSCAEVFETMATDLLKNREALLAILTTGPRARPKARKAVGTTQPRRAAKRNGSIAATLPEPTVEDLTLPRS